MRRSIVPALTILVIVALIATPWDLGPGDILDNASAQGTGIDPTVTVMVDSFSQRAVDEHEQGVYDTIVLSGTLNTNRSGHYKLYARITVEQDSVGSSGVTTTLTTMQQAMTLSVGTNPVLLTLDGRKVRDRELNGTYFVSYSLYFEDGGSLLPAARWDGEIGSHTYDEFRGEGEIASVDTGFEFDGDRVVLSTDVFVGEVSLVTPRLTYFYAGDDGETVRFILSFERLLVLDDDEDEPLYDIDLEEGDWSLSSMQISDHAVTGRRIDIGLSSLFDPVALSNSSQGTPGVANGSNGTGTLVATITFTVSGATYLEGTAGLHVNTTVTFLDAPLGDSVAFVYSIGEEAGDHLLEVGTDLLPLGSFMEESPVDGSGFYLVTPDGTTRRGLIDWDEGVFMRTPNGTLSTPLDAMDGASFVPTSDGGSAGFRISYPSGQDLLEMNHRFWVGLYTAAVPFFEDVVDRVLADPVAYIGGSIVASIILLAPVAWMKRDWGKGAGRGVGPKKPRGGKVPDDTDEIGVEVGP